MTARPRNARIRRAETRARARRAGLRIVTLALPDLRLSSVREQARIQAEAVAASRHEPEDQAFIDAISAGLTG